MVAQADLGKVDAIMYIGLGLHFPRKGDTFTYAAQIDVGLCFPLCEDLEELCCYYGISPTQLMPNAIRMSVRFKIICVCQGWTYTHTLSFSVFLPFGCGANFLHHFHAR